MSYSSLCGSCFHLSRSFFQHLESKETTVHWVLFQFVCTYSLVIKAGNMVFVFILNLQFCRLLSRHKVRELPLTVPTRAVHQHLGACGSLPLGGKIGGGVRCFSDVIQLTEELHNLLLL